MTEETCFPQIPFNELIQEKVINSIFDKLSNCSSEKEVKDKINEIIGEKVRAGEISIQSIRNSTDFQNKVNLLVDCSLTDLDQTFSEDLNLTPSYIVSGVTAFICNPPSFDYPDIDIQFNFSLKDVFNKILFELIDMLMQTIIQIINQIIDVLTNICEAKIDELFQGYEQITNIIRNSFIQTLNLKVDEIDKELEKLFNVFGFKTDGSLVKSKSYPECDTDLYAIKSVNQFLNDLSMMLTPNEICLLLEGSPTNLTLNTIKELLGFDYPLLQTRLIDEIVIVDFFITLGRFVPKDICNNIKQKYQEVIDQRNSNVCNTNLSEREAIRASILSANGIPEEEVRLLLQNERQRYINRFKNLGSFISNYRNDPESVFSQMSTNIFCKNGKNGSVTLQSFPLALNTSKTIINSFFTNFKSTHFRESQNIQDFYFNKESKRRKITRFYSAVPQQNRRIGNIRIENGENSEYKRVQSLGNPLYYTDNQEFALVIEKYEPDVVYTFENQIARKIYSYITDYLTTVGDIILQGPNSQRYRNYLGYYDSFDNLSRSEVNGISEVVLAIYNTIINTDKLFLLSQKLYFDYFVGENAPTYNVFDFNKITKNKILDYFSDQFSFDDIEILERVLGFSGEKINFGNDYKLELPKPNGDILASYQFRNASGDTITILDLENILENFFERAGREIIQQPRPYDRPAESDPFVYLSDYNSITFSFPNPPKLETYTLEQLNVINTENVNNRWLADINKIIKANATDVQPIGILEEFQTSNLINYQYNVPEITNSNNSIGNNNLNYISLYNSTNINLPQDNSVLSIEEIYTGELTNLINSLNSEQIDQVNYLLGTTYNISDVNSINSKTLLYESSSFTNGPFRETSDSLKQEIKNLLPFKADNVSWQIDAFKKISNLESFDYYENLKNIINYFQTNDNFRVDVEDKKIKDLILIIPFEQIIGVKSTKNKCINEYTNDPCAISEDSIEKVPLINVYIAKAQIKLLIKTLCLRQELKDLLSLTKINPYNYVLNDDTYIEFLLQIVKQDIRKLSGNSSAFYDLVIKYIEDEVDTILNIENTLIDPISNQEINLDQELSTDFKIRFFIKQQYSEILERIENLFITTNLDLIRQENLTIIQDSILQNINLSDEVKQQYRNILLEFIYPTSKILSILKINKIILTSKLYPSMNSVYTSSLYSLRENIIAALSNDPLYKDCSNPFSLQTEGIDLTNYDTDAILEMIKSYIITAPIEIVKGLAQSFDPNIRISHKIRDATELLTQTNLPCLPFSLALLPINIFGFGIGPPILPQYGIPYLALDTAEFLLSPKQKALKLKRLKEQGVFDKLEDLSETPENC